MESKQSFSNNNATIFEDTDECEILILANRFDQRFFIEGIYSVSKQLAKHLVDMFDFMSPELAIERLQVVINDLCFEYNSFLFSSEDGQSNDVMSSLDFLMVIDSDIVSRITSEL